MTLEAAKYFAPGFLLGLLCLGLGAYMFDQCQKAGAGKRISTESWTFPFVIPFVPFIYLTRVLRTRPAKGIIIFWAFWLSLIAASRLIALANKHIEETSKASMVTPGAIINKGII